MGLHALPSNGSWMVRRHVGQLLHAYYAQPAGEVVGSTSKLPRLSMILGEWHWKRAFQAAYDQRQGQWLTPVELFRPYYSHILARFCAHVVDQERRQQKVQDGQPTVEIVELGGGRGTNAVHIMTFLQERRPDIFESLHSYTLVDASPTLQELQQTTLETVSDKVQFELVDLLDVAEGNETLFSASNGASSGTVTIVLGLEVLDNLGHDKIQRSNITGKLEQAMIRKDDHGVLKETFSPMTDRLLKEILDANPTYAPARGGPPTWIPSVACGALRGILEGRPNANICLADFDWLPEPSLTRQDGETKEETHSTWAVGEPLVTDMHGQDHPCYLNQRAQCDILFPTDFSKLAGFVHNITQATSGEQNASKKVSVHKQSAFLQEFGKEELAATKSWWTSYHPMIHDFSNCSVLTRSPIKEED